MRNLINSKLLLVIAFSLSFISIGNAQSLEAQVDQLLSTKYPNDGPGATAIITKKGEVIYRKAFGKANLELDVPLNVENVFEIGSMTKQFTAVSILMLMEQGKLSLSDEITKFIPDYPTQGKIITVHQLLNHTSGIKSYTSMPSFQTQARTDLSPMELIDVFKNEPMDFDPGERYLYNNSGYIILGYIIEKVAGESYEEFVENTLFKPAGMKDSRYGHNQELINNRASGYQSTEEGFRNSSYLSMTLPYAAGSLMSTVDDLSKWQMAMNNNMFITKESKEKAWSNYTLNDGKPINYGYGWQPNDINGSPSIEHGGGIFGYTTMGVYVPEEDVYVAVLTNCNCNSPTDITIKIAALAIGKPYPKTENTVSLSAEQLNKWTGTYEFKDGAIRFITLENGQLYSQRKDSSKLKIYPVSSDSFTFEDGLISYTFSMEDGKKTTIFKNRIEVSEGIESDEKAPEPKKEITLAPEILKQYVGKYELQPNFNINVTVEDDKIFVQATGQPQFELFAESEDHFFLKVVAADFTFNKDENGHINSLILNQGGQQMPAKKIE